MCSRKLGRMFPITVPWILHAEASVRKEWTNNDRLGRPGLCLRHLRHGIFNLDLIAMDSCSQFVNHASGLDKVLRFIQAFSQIVAAFVINARPWLQAKKQTALGRRYLRTFKFVNEFQKTGRLSRRRMSVDTMLESGKAGFLGCYLLLESLTIVSDPLRCRCHG